MKAYIAIVTLSIPCCIFAAASPHDERKVVFEEVPTRMLLGTLQATWTDALKIVPEPTGTVPGIYQEILEKGFDGFTTAHPAIKRRMLAIFDHLTQNPPCTCCTAKMKTLFNKSNSLFKRACENPSNISYWKSEFFCFSGTLLLLVNKQLKSKFKVHISTVDCIVDNHGITGSVGDRVEVAAYILAVAARFNQRFIAMGKDEKLFDAFNAELPTLYKRLHEQINKKLTPPAQ
jgi:hypothetical protein